MKKYLFAVFIIAFQYSIFAQNEVRAWSASGQVWVVWKFDGGTPEKIEIYKKENFDSSLSSWTKTGTLFPEMAIPASLRLHVASDFNFKIPTPDGSTYTLEHDEGLFVETIDEDDTFKYAVVHCENESCPEQVVEAQISNVVDYIYDKTLKVEPHLQAEMSFGNSQILQIYYHWTFGSNKMNQDINDYPVMGNEYTNGWPSVFTLWTGPNTDITMPSPAIHWLHGGSGNFSQYFPDKRKEININVNQGVVISHNDDFMRFVNQDLVYNETNSWWFGWSNNHNPFDQFYPGPSDGDTIVNYTQRRLKWIQDWLVSEEIVDSSRTAIQGYSVGSAGTVAMVKTYPKLFSSASIFNCGHRGPDEENFGSLLLGSESQNLPTNLKDVYGSTMHIHQMFDMQHRTSYDDWPLMRSWHGKNDKNPTMQWNPEFLEKVKYADSIGWGYQLFWDERDHPITDLEVHWTHGDEPEEQTEKDNTSYQEKYRNDQSYPVFFNYSKYNIAQNDPGNGQRGTGMGNGDDWGTWGGYHEYDLDGIEDMNDYWSSIVYISGSQAREIDRYTGPENCIKSDFTIRRPQKFKLAPQESFIWEVRDIQNTVIQTGSEIANQEGLPIVRGITTCVDPMRVKIVLKRVLDFGCESTDILVPEAGVYCQSFEVDGVKRSFITIVPESYSFGSEHAIIFAFHGGGGNMQNFAFGHVNPLGGGREEFHDRANAEKIILVYPQALVHPEIGNTSWNTFDNYTDQAGTFANDFAFFEQMLAHHNSILDIDKTRIYAVGYSKGGDFAQLLGRSRSCYLAGVCSVGSSSGITPVFGEPEIDYYPFSENPTPVLMIKGNKDYKRPWEGGYNNSGNFTSSGVEDLENWLENNGCDLSATSEYESNLDSVLVYENISCEINAEVEMIQGYYLEHVWPDLDDKMGINANQLFIDFLKNKKNESSCINEVSKIDLNPIILFPNPATDYLIVETGGLKVKQTSVFNYDGIRVYFSTEQQKVDIRDLQTGVYFLEVQIGEEVFKKVFIKN